MGVAFLASIAAAHSTLGQNPEDLTSWMVDMSSHNAGIKLDRTLTAPEIGAPIRLVIHRATIGTYHPPRERGDPLFSARARAAADVGLLFGAYHVAFPTSDAKAQGEGFVTAVTSQCVPGQQIISAVDWEFVCVRWSDPGRKGKCVQEGVVGPDFIRDWVDAVSSLTHKTPIVYTSSRTLRQFQDYFRNAPDVAARLRELPLWIARYRSRQGQIFPNEDEILPWQDWVFWQFAAGKGIGPTRRSSLRIQNQPIDTNFYQGRREEADSFFARYSWNCGGPR